VNPIANGYTRPADVVMSAFSSWGPTDDGRIKPDLVGNGVAVVSATNSANNAYASLQGTSMATPNVSGTLFLLQELYGQQNQGNFMLAATLKALAIHTANEAGDTPGPDYRFGWGLLNAEQAGTVILNRDRTHAIREERLAQNGTFTLDVIASGNGPLKATIAWTDPEGTVLPVIRANLNNRSPRLVNDLDLRIVVNMATIPLILLCQLLVLFCAIGIGIVISCLARDQSTAESINNLVLLLPTMIVGMLGFLGGVTQYGGLFGLVIMLIPFTHAVIFLNALLSGTVTMSSVLGIIYLLVFTVGTLTVGARLFEREAIVT
ncbi:MAG: S8 family serine peptidase, partial [Candidatus Thorarchaeota archaeon]